MNRAQRRKQAKQAGAFRKENGQVWSLLTRPAQGVLYLGIKKFKRDHPTDYRKQAEYKSSAHKQFIEEARKKG